jgi:hypothetical protein
MPHPLSRQPAFLPSSLPDYNHYEVSVTIANPYAVFGHDVIDMMRLETIDPNKCAVPGCEWLDLGILPLDSSEERRSTALVE